MKNFNPDNPVTNAAADVLRLCPNTRRRRCALDYSYVRREDGSVWTRRSYERFVDARGKKRAPRKFKPKVPKTVRHTKSLTYFS
jgi:hypothetical protein